MLLLFMPEMPSPFLQCSRLVPKTIDETRLSYQRVWKNIKSIIAWSIYRRWYICFP